jgi:hypothetical protein
MVSYGHGSLTDQVEPMSSTSLSWPTVAQFGRSLSLLLFVRWISSKVPLVITSFTLFLITSTDHLPLPCTRTEWMRLSDRVRMCRPDPDAAVR